MDFSTLMDLPDEILDRKKYNYAWVCDDKRVVALALGHGYETVKVTDPEGLKFKPGDPRLRADNVIGIGDAILMRCPLADANKRRAARRNRTKRAVAAIKEEFHAEAARLGVPSFEDSAPKA